MTLKNNIEAIIIKWAYQIDEVLSKDSAEELNVPNEFPGTWFMSCLQMDQTFSHTNLNFGAFNIAEHEPHALYRTHD